jgi:co-chaperonin GroES (HSP10)
MRFEAVNNVIILKKDREESFDKISTKDMRQIPPPYTGVVDSVGYKDCGYKVGDKIAFDEIGGVLLSTEIDDYVVITPEMVIGIL